MKGKLILTVLSLVVLFFSCKKEDDDSSSSGAFEPSYVNQTLQGKIEGNEWFFSAGNVNSSESFFDSSKVSHAFSTSDTSASDTCFLNNFKRARIIFSLDEVNQILAVGSHTLKFDFSGDDNKSVTFVSYETDIPFNNIATKGAYEILSVDTTKKLVTGRMDVEIDKDNFVNGNFTMKYCSW